MATSSDHVQSQRIYRILRSAITFGEYEPGDRLRVIEIAGREGASPGAVREALSALASEHLVVPLPQRGFRVAPLYHSDMFDLFTTRAELEADLAARSVQNGDQRWLAHLTSAWNVMINSDEPQRGSRQAASDHEAFHRGLIAGCGSTWSLRLFETVYTASERYRYYAFRNLVAGRNPDEEHREIYEAAVSRDSARTRDLCRAHILRTRDVLSQALKDTPSEVA